MQTSIFLAALIGPVMLVAATGMLLNPASHRAMSLAFLDSPPLIYLSGVLAMIAGLAIVLYHNVWAADWRVIITLFGWARRCSTRHGLVIAAVLCFYGYFR